MRKLAIAALVLLFSVWLISTANADEERGEGITHPTITESIPVTGITLPDGSTSITTRGIGVLGGIGMLIAKSIQTHIETEDTTTRMGTFASGGVMLLETVSGSPLEDKSIPSHGK
jgi:di/tricarboxylate transporter